jgi:alpha/beta superfamily hydrolase
MEGIPIGLLSGWAFGSTIAMAVVMMVAKGTWVPGSTHQAMTEDRNYWRAEAQRQQQMREAVATPLMELLEALKERIEAEDQRQVAS